MRSVLVLVATLIAYVAAPAADVGGWILVQPVQDLVEFLGHFRKVVATAQVHPKADVPAPDPAHGAHQALHRAQQASDKPDPLLFACLAVVYSRMGDELQASLWLDAAKGCEKTLAGKRDWVLLQHLLCPSCRTFTGYEAREAMRELRGENWLGELPKEVRPETMCC